MSYKFTQLVKDALLQRIQKEIEDNFVSFDKNGDIRINTDIHCKSLYVEGDSIYIGGVKLAQPTAQQNTYYVTYNDEAQEFEYVSTTTTVVSKTAAYTASFNNLIICDGTFTVALPNITSSDIGKPVTIYNVGEGVITVDGNGDDTFYGEKTIECIAGVTLSLMAVTTSTWVLI